MPGCVARYMFLMKKLRINRFTQLPIFVSRKFHGSALTGREIIVKRSKYPKDYVEQGMCAMDRLKPLRKKIKDMYVKPSSATLHIFPPLIFLENLFDGKVHFISHIYCISLNRSSS